jgi:hypothetical protein
MSQILLIAPADDQRRYGRFGCIQGISPSARVGRHRDVALSSVPFRTYRVLDPLGIMSRLVIRGIGSNPGDPGSLAG